MDMLNTYQGPNAPERINRITIDERILSGRPVIRDTGIPVELVIAMLIYGARESEILEEYCELEPEDLNACIAFACGRYC